MASSWNESDKCIYKYIENEREFSAQCSIIVWRMEHDS